MRGLRKAAPGVDPLAETFRQAAEAFWSGETRSRRSSRGIPGLRIGGGTRSSRFQGCALSRGGMTLPGKSSNHSPLMFPKGWYPIVFLMLVRSRNTTRLMHHCGSSTPSTDILRTVVIRQAFDQSHGLRSNRFSMGIVEAHDTTSIWTEGWAHRRWNAWRPTHMDGCQNRRLGRHATARKAGRNSGLVDEGLGRWRTTCCPSLANRITPRAVRKIGHEQWSRSVRGSGTKTESICTIRSMGRRERIHRFVPIKCMRSLSVMIC